MPVDSMLSRFNPLVCALLRSPLHWIASSGLALITVTGRRTGKRYTIPVGYQRDADVLVVLVSEARGKQWWRNYEEPAPIELRLHGRDLTGVARVVSPESAEFRERVETTLRRVPGLSRVFRVDFDRRTGVTDDQHARLAAEIAVVRIDLDG